MSEASPEPIDHFPAFLERLPPSLDVEKLARETKAFQRPRGIRSGTDLLRLALAWGCGGYSLQSVAAWAGEHGIARLTDEALIQRLHGAGPFLEAVSNELLACIDKAPCWHGRVLRIADSTSLSKQASKGTDWRIHGVFDLGLGGFSHLELTDGHGGEALDRGKSVAGEIRIGDRGYANAQAWQRFLQNREEPTDFIVRMRWSSIRLIDEAGEVFDIITWLKTRPTEREDHEIAVWACSGKHQTPKQIRLIARRKSPEAIEKAHKELRRHASRKQHDIDPRSYVAAEFLVLATSLPAEEFPAEQVLAVYRLRWQIELAFKRLKSLINIDEIRTRTEAGTRCWLYANLIVALLADDCSQDLLASFPSGTR
jgi:IS4 transposase